MKIFSINTMSIKEKFLNLPFKERVKYIANESFRKNYNSMFPDEAIPVKKDETSKFVSEMMSKNSYNMKLGKEQFEKLPKREQEILLLREHAIQNFNSKNFIYKIPDEETSSVSKYVKFRVMMFKILEKVTKNFK